MAIVEIFVVNQNTLQNSFTRLPVWGDRSLHLEPF